MNGILVTLIIIAILLVVIVSIYLIIKEKLARLSRSIFGVDNLLEGFKKQEMELESTPKSVSSMDSVEIPKILKDFPDIDINEIKSMAVDGLIKYYKCLEKGKLEKIINGTEKLNGKILSEIERLEKVNQKVSEMKVHRSVINSYKKNRGMCIITVQSSIEYKLKKDEVIKRVQDRVNVELIYIYDETKLDEKYGVSLNCKNCGAPIRELGTKTCPYCGTGIVVYTSKTWKIDDIKSV